MAGEIWRIVPSLPELLVSNEGRMMHVPKQGAMPHGGHRHYGGQPTFGVWNKVDSRFVTTINGKNYKIHRLVAEAFLGPPPFQKAVVMHIDENSANNRSDNLKWATQKENLNGEAFKEYCCARTGENSPYAKGIALKGRTA
jgi:hypothetical protein